MSSRTVTWTSAVERDGEEIRVTLHADVYEPHILAPDDYPETEVWCDELELTADECSWFEEKAERLARGETEQ
jgi:hypothetical protein